MIIPCWQDVRCSNGHVETDGGPEARASAVEAVAAELRYEAPSSELLQLSLSG